MHHRFLETEVLTADPLTLVRLLYRGAIDSVVSAKQHLASGQIEERSKSIAKAQAILSELTNSLNREAGGQLANNLCELYDYMQRRLNTAAIEQQAAPLIEVEALLRELYTAWQEISRAHPPPVAEEHVPVHFAG